MSTNKDKIGVFIERALPITKENIVAVSAYSDKEYVIYLRGREAGKQEFAKVSSNYSVGFKDGKQEAYQEEIKFLEKLSYNVKYDSVAGEMIRKRATELANKLKLKEKTK